MASLDVAPTTRSSSLPPLNSIKVGIPLMPYRCEIDGLSSTFTLTTRAVAAYFSATAATVGSSMRQGAHQVAQKSTSTGLSDCNTSFSKLLSFTSSIFAPILAPLFTAISVFPLCLLRVLFASMVNKRKVNTHHRDTENTEEAQSCRLILDR